MKPVHQTKFGDPEGNCMAACLASLLEIPIEDVPTLVEHPGWYMQLERYLATHGLVPITYPFNQGVPPDTYYILAGMSARGLMHSVIGFNGDIVHDPHPDNTGLVTRQEITVLARTFVTVATP